MRLANICGSDLHYWRGDADLVGRGFEMPYALGHEGVGEVFRLGTGVTTDSAGQPVREGDRVVFRYFDPCGRCAVCLRDHPYACPHRQRERLRGVRHWPHFRGTFAQYYYLYPGHTMFRVPEGLTDASVAGVNCALTQVVSGLDRAQLSPGESVAIQGAGGLGTLRRRHRQIARRRSHHRHRRHLLTPRTGPRLRRRRNGRHHPDRYSREHACRPSATSPAAWAPT